MNIYGVFEGGVIHCILCNMNKNEYKKRHHTMNGDKIKIGFLKLVKMSAPPLESCFVFESFLLFHKVFALSEYHSSEFLI